MNFRRIGLWFIVLFAVGLAVGIFIPRLAAEEEPALSAPSPPPPVHLDYTPASRDGRLSVAFVPGPKHGLLIPISIPSSAGTRYWSAISAALGNLPGSPWPQRLDPIPLRRVWREDTTLHAVCDIRTLDPFSDPVMVRALAETVRLLPGVDLLRVWTRPLAAEVPATLDIIPGFELGSSTPIEIDGRVWLAVDIEDTDDPKDPLGAVRDFAARGNLEISGDPTEGRYEITVAPGWDPPDQAYVEATSDLLMLGHWLRGDAAVVTLTCGTVIGLDQGERLFPNPLAVDAPEPFVRMAMVGDVSLGRRLTTLMREHGPGYPFDEIAHVLADYDLVIANLESPITNRGDPIPNKGIWLRADPAHAPALGLSGIDAVNLANNHMVDYDSQGVLDTIAIVGELGILSFGAGCDLDSARAPAVIEAGGIRFALLGYTQYADIFWSYDYRRMFAATDELPGVAPLDESMILADVGQAVADCDVLIVSLHWGEEDTHYPTEQQRSLAARIIAAGASMIMGHHPHVLQGFEVIDGRPVLYSLGNFVYDQYRQANVRTGIVALDFDSAGPVRLTAIPVLVVEARPTVPDEEQAAAIEADFRRYSLPLGTEFHDSDHPSTDLR